MYKRSKEKDSSWYFTVSVLCEMVSALYTPFVHGRKCRPVLKVLIGQPSMYKLLLLSANLNCQSLYHCV